MIDYGLLEKSIEYYENLGYPRIETPWMVSKPISDLTKPKDAIDFKIEYNGKILVASGEQGFLYLYTKGYLPKGRFCTVSPCYRHDNYSVTHMKTFMKNELIITDKVDEIELHRMIDQCQIFFESIIEDKVDLVTTEIGYDLEYKGLELGSYGIRDFGWLKFIYGTGCALPRLSRAKLLDL